LFVQAALITLEPTIIQFFGRDAIAFQVVDSLDGDSARGDYAGNMGGIIRPRLEWQTIYKSSNGR
jgi:lipopolysaccharide transport system ATP-binding protein